MHVYLKALVAFALGTAPQIGMADMALVDKSFIANKSYANEIEVKAFIITREQACAALRNPPQEPVQLNKQELFGEKTFLLLQIRNSGKKQAWGTLSCTVPRYSSPIKVPIFDLVNRPKYNTYLFHLGLLGIIHNDTSLPEIFVEWDELYTK